MQTVRRPRPMRPLSIHMMPDFSAYDSYNTNVSPQPVGPVGGPPSYSHKSLKRKRSESTDDSDDADNDNNYYHRPSQPLQPLFGRPYLAETESGYKPSKSDERGHAAKRARLADDFADLRLRGQSISPISGVNPVPVSLWPSAPVVEERESASPLAPALAPVEVEVDLTDDYAHAQSRRGVQVAPDPSGPFSLNLSVNSPDVLRGEVEEVVSPGVQAERSRNTTTTDGNEHDIKMHGTSSYEPEKDRIIITDLDDFSDSDGESSGPPLASTSTSAPASASTPYKISSAYLSRFGHIPRPEFEFEDLDAVESKQALVAYRPLIQTINGVPSRPEVFRGYIEEVEDGVVDSNMTMEGTSPNGFMVEPYPGDAMDVDME